VRIKTWENDLVLEPTNQPTNQPTYSYLSELLKKYAFFMSWGILGVMLALPAFANEGDWKEKEALRDGQTRVWESMKAQEVKNPFTGEISINTVSHQYYEKADGVNYNIGTPKKPQWVPSVERIKATEDPYFPYQADEGPYKVKFGVSIDQTTPIEYSIGNDTIRLGLKYLAYYDKKNGNLKPFKTLNHVNPVVEGNKVIYKNAFTGIDVEYVYQKGVFQQNIIINSKSNLESPISYGISTDNAYLVAVTELDTTDFSTEFVNTKGEKMAQGLLKGESCDILFKKKGKAISQLAPSIVYFKSINRGCLSKESTYQEDTVVREITQYRHIFQQNNKNYLLEGIALNDLDEAIYPITLDYEIKAGGSDSNQTWKEGFTYYLSGDYTITNGNTLVIEPGTIVKYATAKKLAVASGGRLIAKGDKFNYILMTSKNDNEVGETITGSNGSPQASDYTTAINLQANTVSNHYIQYCKISYAYCGLDIQTKIDNPVENNIFRNDFMYPVKISSVSSPSGDGITFRNNLITGTMYCISLYGGTNYVELYNNTLYGFGCGVYIGSGSPLTQAKYNLFSNGNVGFNGVSISDSVHSYNYHYNISFPILNGSSQYEYVISTSNPLYDNSSNGSFYLANVNAKNCVYMGFMTNASELSLLSMITTKTTQKPVVVTSSSCGDHWIKVSRDNDGYLDVGYHYDPVDIVVGTSASDYAINYGTGLITIDPGVVVSFYRDSTHRCAQLQLSGLGCVSTGGTPSDRVQFTSIYATSDLPTLPKRGGQDTYDYECAIFLNTGSKTIESSIQNCKFQYADEAVFTNISLNIDKAIRDNLFRKNVYGFCITNRMGNVVNNIFDSNNYGIKLYQNDVSRQINYIQSNTFYSNQTAVYAQQSINSQGKLTFRLENNIMVGNKMGACGTGVTGGFTAETRNNVYWNNDSNVDGTWVHFNTLGGENSDTAVNPLLSHSTRSQNSAWIPKNSDDGFYLAQRSGDASRFPLIASGVQNISIPNSSQFPSGTNIFVGISSSVVVLNLGEEILNDYKGHLEIGNSFESGNQSGTGPLWIMIGDISYAWEKNDIIFDNATVNITLSNGEIVTVCLPQSNVDQEEAMIYWIASDGSVYHASSTHSAIYSECADKGNQDAWYAMGYDMPNGLAKSAYDGGARSGAVDRGAVKVTTYQGNTYKYTLSVSTGYTNTNKVIQDNNSLCRKISATIPTQTADPVGRLDAGFHYGSSVYHTTDAVTTFGMNNRIYKYSDDIAWDPTYDISLFPSSCTKEPYLRRVVSSNYNTNTLINSEVMVFPAFGPLINPNDGNSRNYLAIGYHLHNTPLVGGIVEYISDIRANALISMTSKGDVLDKLGPRIRYVDSAATSEGDTLVAVQWDKYYLSQGQSIQEENVNTYRFDENNYSWVTVMSLVNSHQLEYGTHIGGMAIAGDDSNLWLSISGTNLEDNTMQLKMAKIPLKYNNQYLNDQSYTYSGIVPFADNDSPLAMTYDANENCGRVIFYKDEGDGNIFELMVGPDINGNLERKHLKPVNDEKASWNGYVTGLPIGSIAYNPNDTTGNLNRCFVGYHTYDSYLALAHHDKLNAVNPNDEFWYSANDSISCCHGTPDVTYRGDGSILMAYYRHIPQFGLNTNAGNLHETVTNEGGCLLKVCTNPINKRDIFATWHERDNIDTTDDGYEGYAVCREVYP
jgi:hypothetical protein